jgi:hypothetical protein
MLYTLYARKLPAIAMSGLITDFIYSTNDIQNLFYEYQKSIQ